MLENAMHTDSNGVTPRIIRMRISTVVIRMYILMKLNAALEIFTA